MKEVISTFIESSTHESSPVPVSVVGAVSISKTPFGTPVELVAMNKGAEKVVAQTTLISMPRRGESVEYYSEELGQTQLFRVMDVVHTGTGLRLYGHISKGFSLNSELDANRQ